MKNHSMGGVGRDLCGSSSPTPCPSRVTQSRLHRTLPIQVLNISREGDSTASLGSLGQGSVTLRGKKFFLMFFLMDVEERVLPSLSNSCCLSVLWAFVLPKWLGASCNYLRLFTAGTPGDKEFPKFNFLK